MDGLYGNEDIDGAPSDDESVIQPSPSVHANASNAYPDPEDIPTYPWFGSKVGEKETYVPGSSIEPLNTLISSLPEESSGGEDAAYIEAGEMTHARFDYNNASADPDFQDSGGNSMYVNVLDTMRMCISDRKSVVTKFSLKLILKCPLQAQREEAGSQ